MLNAAFKLMLMVAVSDMTSVDVGLPGCSSVSLSLARSEYDLLVGHELDYAGQREVVPVGVRYTVTEGATA